MIRPRYFVGTVVLAYAVATGANTTPLENLALSAVANNPNSHVELALDFVSKACPGFMKEDNDRLVKVGRRIESLIALKDSVPLEPCLAGVVEECRLLANHQVKVPTVRYGKTELMISRVSLGCMRFQQAWGDRVQNMNTVQADCQDNLVRILKRAILEFGINHIETARMYGCSELQLGVALKQLFDTGTVKREDLIIQTKVTPFSTAEKFRETLETSFRTLKLDYIDLFSFHGLNMPHQYDWLFNNGENGNLMDVVKEYVRAGKIRHVGFSTHGPADLIHRFIMTDQFEYVNLHYHYFGSYTTTGIGVSLGNLATIQLMKEKDMGVFIISPFDKGGKLYEPPNKLRCLTLPEMEPMAFGGSWIWTHDQREGTPVHTLVVGAARPSDLDEAAVSAYLCHKDSEAAVTKVNCIVARLEKAKEEALGKEWLKNCFKGIPKSNTSKHAVEHNQIVWCYNVIKAFGMLQFAKDRYGSLERTRAKWNPELSVDENIENVGKIGWGFNPGLSLDPDVDYSDDLEAVPEEMKEKIKDAEAFVHRWCCKPKPPQQKSGEGTEQKAIAVEEEVPFDWQTSYKMGTWMDFPDRARIYGSVINFGD